MWSQESDPVMMRRRSLQGERVRPSLLLGLADDHMPVIVRNVNVVEWYKESMHAATQQQAQAK